AAPEITASIRKVHDFLTVGAAAPLQVAAAEAFNFGSEYYEELAGFYSERRDYLLTALEKAGFTCMRPQGAYYIMADITPFGWDDDVAFAKYMASEIGVAVVPGSSFFRSESTAGKQLIRFCFCKKFETLQAAADRLEKLKVRTI
ncbi:MAG: ybdL 2, partial [Firmicutes bacterium]|nr:ybdL 2 [Bacillota bacterium]